jgi:hypothetical protein
LLQRNGFVHRVIFNVLELGWRDPSSGRVLSGLEQFGRAEQAADHVSVGRDHGLLTPGSAVKL